MFRIVRASDHGIVRSNLAFERDAPAGVPGQRVEPHEPLDDALRDVPPVVVAYEVRVLVHHERFDRGQSFGSRHIRRYKDDGPPESNGDRRFDLVREAQIDFATRGFREPREIVGERAFERARARFERADAYEAPPEARKTDERSQQPHGNDPERDFARERGWTL